LCGSVKVLISHYLSQISTTSIHPL